MKRNKRGFVWYVKRFLSSISNIQKIFIIYLLTTLLATFLLMAPFSRLEKVSFIDAMFTVASAFSDTGLTTLTTATTWTPIGWFIIALIIILGGIGIFALKVYIINILFGKPITILSKKVLEKERGSTSSGELRRMIKVSINFLFFSIILGAVVLLPMFYFEQGNFQWENGHGEFQDFSKFNPKGDFVKSLVCSIFHSITAINNAGFDILSNASIYPYYHVYSIQIVFIILLVIGGIGYPVIYEFILFISHKIKRRTDFKFSVFSKLSCLTYLIVTLVGLCFSLMFDIWDSSGIWYNPKAGTYTDKIMCIIFHVFSTRSAGFTTIDPTLFKFSNSTLIIFSVMMFIGCAPSSTAGGIRTTTLALIVISIFNKMRGINSTRAFKRKINDKAVSSSFSVLAISILIVLITTLICSTSYDTMWGTVNSQEISFADILYDVCSAFGTTGLSTGMIGGLNIVSKVSLIILMFIGQLGISSTMLVWKGNNQKNDYSYIEEDIMVG